VSPDKEEIRRLLDVLRTLLRMLGVSNREVERRLKLKHSAVTRLFSGVVEAKLELVLGIVRVVGLEYDEFFGFVYPERRTPAEQSAAARRINSLIQDLHPAPFRAAPPVSERPAPQPAPPAMDAAGREEMLRDLREVVRQVLKEIEEGPHKPDDDEE
jgi:transcriptional regulator with XRE-family HTH domain